MSRASLLFVVALVFFVFAALGAFGVVAGLNVAGFGYLGLAFLAGGLLA